MDRVMPRQTITNPKHITDEPRAAGSLGMRYQSKLIPSLIVGQGLLWLTPVMVMANWLDRWLAKKSDRDNLLVV